MKKTKTATEKKNIIKSNNKNDSDEEDIDIIEDVMPDEDDDNEEADDEEEEEEGDDIIDDDVIDDDAIDDDVDVDDEKDNDNEKNDVDDIDEADEDIHITEDEDEKNTIKQEEDEDGDILLNFEPEIIDYSLIDEEDINIIVESKTTKPFLTKYEKVKLLAFRTNQIARGAKPMIKIQYNMSSKNIAKAELNERVIPLLLLRPIPNGKAELWNIRELEFDNV